MPYKIIGADNGDAWLDVKGRKHAAADFASAEENEETAEDYLGEPVTEAVITVPAI